MLAAVRTAQPVVRAHQAPHAGAEHRGFERWQVQLAQRPFGHLHADREALVLLVVAYEVLDARTDAALLDAFDVGDCHLGGEIRIFRKAFEVASVQWMAVNVHRAAHRHLSRAPRRRARVRHAAPGRGSTLLPAPIRTAGWQTIPPPNAARARRPGRRSRAARGRRPGRSARCARSRRPRSGRLALPGSGQPRLMARTSECVRSPGLLSVQAIAGARSWAS